MMLTIADLFPLTAEELRFVRECNQLAMTSARIAEEILDNRRSRSEWNTTTARQRVGGTFGS